jgi:HSP20 family molecular chaperone IbpA
MSDVAKGWMLADAIEMLARAERMHQQMFRPRTSSPARACWEPPVDVIETDSEVVVIAALPGVDPESVQAVIVDGTLQIRGRRTLPAELRTATIHRLELPQGVFERRVAIPPGRYGAVRRSSVNGCLLVHLLKQR